MTKLQLATSSQQLENKPSVSTFQETLRSHNEGSDGVRPMASLMPQVNIDGSLDDLMLLRVWQNHVIWRAGVSVLTSEHISTDHRICF